MRPPHELPNPAFFRFEGSATASPEEAYWTWRNIVSVLFDTALPDAAAVDAFQVTVDSYHLGPLLVGSVTSTAQRFRRSPAVIARSGVDHYFVQLYPQGGYAGDADGRPVHVAPGDISILDLSRPLQTQAGSFRNISLVVPRPVLAPLVKNPDGLHGLVLSGRSGLGHLLATYMHTIHATAGSLSAAEGEGITDATASLIAGCFGPSMDARDVAAKGLRGAQVLAIKRYIDGNLAAPDLTVETIVRAFRVSRATLARMFEPDRGLAHYIRERRMLRCFAAITSPAEAHRSIGDLAYAWGFGNEAAFSRAFRQMFDMSPREARSAAGLARHALRERLARDHQANPPILAQWIRHLKV